MKENAKQKQGGKHYYLMPDFMDIINKKQIDDLA